MRHKIFEFGTPPTDPYHPGDTPQDYLDEALWAVDNIDFPWSRLLRGLWRKGLSSIHVEWVDSSDPRMPAGSIGVFDPNTATIYISYQYGLSGTGFTMAHECGHAVDALSFSWEIQQEIMAYWHTMQCYYHNRQSDTGGPYIWSHEYPHPEQWVSAGNVNYAHKHNEAYADAFVAAFAPVVWGSKGANTRFSHWPVDFSVNPPITHYDKIRELTLKENIVVFNDVPTTHPQYADIMWMAENGITQGSADPSTPDPNDRIFKPSDPVTRAQMASFMHRLFTLMGGVG
jgi:hypothetical protein